jgi:hypothetical protein
VSRIASNAFAIISCVIPSGLGVFPLTTIKLYACLSSSIKTGFQSYLKCFRRMVGWIESGGGLGNSVFRRAIHLPLKVSFPFIEGIRPYVKSLVYAITLKIDLGSVFSRNLF